MSTVTHDTFGFRFVVFLSNSSVSLDVPAANISNWNVRLRGIFVVSLEHSYDRKKLIELENSKKSSTVFEVPHCCYLVFVFNVLSCYAYGLELPNSHSDM